MTTDVQPGQTPRASFIRNVFWGWIGVAVNLVLAIFLSPIIIRKLGVEQYGVWVLLFSLLDYMRVLDFGFRAAVLNACARGRAREDWTAVNRAIVSALAYFLAIGSFCVGAAIALRGVLIGATEVSAALQPMAKTLVVIIAVTITIRLVLSPLTAALEAFQRFDLVNHAYIGSLLFRTTMSLTLLFLGFGLWEVALVVLVAQVGESLYAFVRVKQLVPQFHVSPRLIGRDTLVWLFRYGRYSAVISAANLVSINAPATALGYVRGAAEVGYFALPFRLLMYAAEGLAKVSDVTSSVTAALDEKGQKQQLWRLAVLTNRHCFALFMPLAIYLSVYGTPLLRLWVTPDVAEHSGGLLPVLALGFLFAISGQYNAGGVLIGQGRHAAYAYGAIVEAAGTIVCLWLFVPQYGVAGAAWVVTLALLVGRGAYLAFLLCRQNEFPLWQYLVAVYGRGLLAGAIVTPVAIALRQTVWPGHTWLELAFAGVAVSAVYFGLAFFVVLEEQHRQRVLRVFAAAV